MNCSENNIDTIFVDCFNTIIFRKVKAKEIFILWAKKIEKAYNIKWKTFYRKYRSINFNMCFKKTITSFNLLERFENVLIKLHSKFSKKHALDNVENFVSKTTDLYVETELENFYINKNMLQYLKTEKKNGKKIYLVSDFYCDSKILTKWFAALNISHVFDKIFSSCDFEKEKATTKLYKHLLLSLQLNPKNVIMFGDNIWSDVMMAKRCKLNAKRITPKTNLNNKG